MKDTTIGLTGSTGFLGKTLLTYLTERGFTVRCLIRDRSKVDADNPDVEYIHGDICKPETLPSFLEGLDVCIHLAAFVGYGTRKQYNEVNVQGTKNICDFLIGNNPSCHFIFCSSIAVLKRKKVFTVLNTEYAESKYKAQQYVEEKSATGELKSSIVYSGMIYGPKDERFIPTVIRYIEEEKLMLITGGEKNAPLIYIDDLCQLFCKIALSPSSVNNSYIGVQPNDKGIHDFYRSIARELGLKESFRKIPKFLIMPLAVFFDGLHQIFRIPKPPVLSKRTVDVLSLSFRIPEKYRTNNLQWFPSTSLDDGLKRSLAWISRKKQKGESDASN